MKGKIMFKYHIWYIEAHIRTYLMTRMYIYVNLVTKFRKLRGEIIKIPKKVNNAFLIYRKFL